MANTRVSRAADVFSERRSAVPPHSDAPPLQEPLAGYIFISNNETMEEDLKRELFGESAPATPRPTPDARCQTREAFSVLETGQKSDTRVCWPPVAGLVTLCSLATTDCSPSTALPVWLTVARPCTFPQG